MTVRIERCSENDRDALHAMRASAESWLKQKGLSQFQGGWSVQAHKQIDKLLNDGRFVGLRSTSEDLTAVGALVAPDPDFWRREDDLGSAWYLARLMVNDHGGGHGAQLINAIALAAALDGRRYLRLDCWRTNKALHSYYKQNFFAMLRVETLPHRESGALFERDLVESVPSPWDAGADKSRDQ